MKKRILAIIGTRPEAIKMAPVVMKLQEDCGFEPLVCATGQHRELLQDALGIFGIRPDSNLDVMKPNQDLFALTARLMDGLMEAFRKFRPDGVLVQGDTTSSFAGALAAFYENTWLGHVEAGLRSGDRRNPFPEEMNRILADRLSSACFAPTGRAAAFLRSEGIADANIHVTGNTVIDALLWVRNRTKKQQGETIIPGLEKAPLEGRRIVLVTCHRRESFGEPIRHILEAVKAIAAKRDDVAVIYPVHPNPNVLQAASEVLSGARNVQMIRPVPYVEFVALMDMAYLVLTDSGGIQEEAPSLGKPVIVLRDTTERPEGVEAGNAVLAGTDRDSITEHALRLLDDEKAYRAMAHAANPYGDGRAAEKIIGIVKTSLGG
ncbi:MAG TPA: UDP-N-acetylglucosamine 2-epimerase (non-hydrolyzing) [Planctomycetes bacterium]|nr:UDP-N-acetylglucosamine 2-epimerase (non-hydrolyzing) [Planctomycetota bacterium]